MPSSVDVGHPVRWVVGWLLVATIVVLTRDYHPAWPLASPLTLAWAVALVALFVTVVVPSVWPSTTPLAASQDVDVGHPVRWTVGWLLVATIVVLARDYHPSWPLVSTLAWSVALGALFVTVVVPSLRGS